MTIVTGASTNHFRCLCHLLYTAKLYEPDSRLLVYDLGLGVAERRHIQKFKGMEHRIFNFKQYPEWTRFQAVGGGAEQRGCYAWKPIIVYDVLQEFGGMVLWLDAGDLIHGPLHRLRQVLEQEGIYSPRSSGNIGKWTHPKTLEYMKASKELLEKSNRNAAIVGFNTASKASNDVAGAWKLHALKKECIAPAGASLDNHRYDQAILSVLMEQYRELYGYHLINNMLEISTHNDFLKEDELRAKLQQHAVARSKPEAIFIAGKNGRGQAMLKHLVVELRGGLCNRLRAIASTKRLCTINHMRCTILWKWGNHDELLQADPTIEWTAELPSDTEDNYTRVKHLVENEGGNCQNRRIWLTKDARIILNTCYAYNAYEEPRPISVYDLAPWLPMPSELLLNKVRHFKQTHFNNTVGMHMRRTDNTRAFELTPDELYFQEAAQLIDSGHSIFLATDNRDVEKMMRDKYGNKIIVYPKNPELVKRWPRKGFNFQETADDLVDLFLLASCEFVVGTSASSYSVLATIYNGSPDCRLLKLEK
jgi:Protein of unknown function (DUF1647)